MFITEVLFESVLILTLVLLVAYIYQLKKKHNRCLKDVQAGAEIGKIAFDKTPLGMCITRPDLTYIDINPSFCRIVGYTKDELMKIIHKDLIHPEDRENDTPYVKGLLEGKQDSYESVRRYIHKQGRIVWAKAMVSLIRDENGNPKFFVIQIQDITQRKSTEDALRKAKVEAEALANIDYLTCCLNRRAFMTRLEEELARAKRNNTRISLIMVDLDDFKSINDFFGHLAGDSVLRQFAHCLNSGKRAYDFVSRFGGEEFIICLPDTEIKDAFLIAERMRQSVEDMVTDYEDVQIKVTGSFGVACSYPGVEEPVDHIIGRADKAMYVAKNTKNKVFQSA